MATLTLGKTSTKPAGTFVRDDHGRVAVVQTPRLRELPSRAADLQPPPPPTPADGGSAG